MIHSEICSSVVLFMINEVEALGFIKLTNSPLCATVVNESWVIIVTINQS